MAVEATHLNTQNFQPLHPHLRWADAFLRDVLPVSGNPPTRSETTTHGQPFVPTREANKRTSTSCTEPCQARLSGRAACRQKADEQIQNTDCQLLLLSPATRRASKKLNLCGLLPVARTLPCQLIYGPAPNANGG